MQTYSKMLEIDHIDSRILHLHRTTSELRDELGDNAHPKEMYKVLRPGDFIPIAETLILADILHNHRDKNTAVVTIALNWEARLTAFDLGLKRLEQRYLTHRRKDDCVSNLAQSLYDFGLSERVVEDHFCTWFRTCVARFTWVAWIEAHDNEAPVKSFNAHSDGGRT